MSKYKFGDFAINCTEKKMPEPEDYANYIGLEHMDSKCLKITRWGSDVPIIGEKLIMHKGDILLGKRNAYLRRAAIAPFDGIFSAHGMILRPKEDIVDYDFFALFIASDYFFDEAIRISVGSLSPTINWKDLKELEFNIPDIATQKEIAKVLWSITDTIDSYKGLIKQSDELVKSRFIEMFMDENNKDKYPLKKWEDVVTVKHGKDYKKNIVGKGGYPVYGSGGFMGVYADNYLVNENATIIGRKGTIDKPLLVKEKFWNVDTAFGIEVNKEFLNPVFFYVRSTLVDLRSLSTSTTLPSMTKETLHKIEIGIPPIELQNEFASFVEQIDKSKFELQNCVDKANAMYKKIMKENLGKEEE